MEMLSVSETLAAIVGVIGLGYGAFATYYYKPDCCEHMGYRCKHLAQCKNRKEIRIENHRPYL